MNMLASCQNRAINCDLLLSCAIPLEMYKYSEAVVRLGIEERLLENQWGKEKSNKELEARREDTHSQGKI